MSYEREFCGLSEYVRLQNVRLIIKFTDVFKQDAADLAYADLNLTSNFEAVWGQYGLKSLKLFHSHSNITFLNQIFLPDYEGVDLILFNKQ